MVTKSSWSGQIRHSIWDPISKGWTHLLPATASTVSRGSLNSSPCPSLHQGIKHFLKNVLNVYFVLNSKLKDRFCGHQVLSLV